MMNDSKAIAVRAMYRTTSDAKIAFSSMRPSDERASVRTGRVIVFRTRSLDRASRFGTFEHNVMGARVSYTFPRVPR